MWLRPTDRLIERFGMRMERYAEGGRVPLDFDVAGVVAVSS